MSTATNNALSVQETGRLAIHEAEIESGMAIFVVVGRALMAIRDDRLFRARYKTFEDYCQERWGFAQSYAYRLIASAEVAQRVAPQISKSEDGESCFSPMGENPTSERQVRPLTTLPESEQADAWKEAVDTAPSGKPTAKHVEAVVKKRKASPDREPRVRKPPEEPNEIGVSQTRIQECVVAELDGKPECFVMVILEWLETFVAELRQQ